MRSLGIRGIAGNMNLRGKRIMKLGCGCCEVQDFRFRVRDREARQEMRGAEAEDIFDYVSEDEYEDMVIQAVSETVRV